MNLIPLVCGIAKERMKPEDIADLKQLIEFLKEHQVAEFDLDRGDLKIRLKFNQPSGGSAGLGELARLLASAPQGVAQAATAQTVGHAVAVPVSAAPVADPDAGLHIVKSPIVGTYYGSPSPGAAAFVSPGDHVDKGQVICIVEAMKLMNEIESDAAGEIVKCLVSNGQPIEFGQPLFSIRVA
jgi:acetyl-CoA carboxylase biotin carboxyl carrier protein